MPDLSVAQAHDWVIEKHEVRMVTVPLLREEVGELLRVTEIGRWVYVNVGPKERRMAIDAGLGLPRFRQGQRVSMDSAIRNLHCLKIILPETEFRARNVETGDILMGAIF